MAFKSSGMARCASYSLNYGLINFETVIYSVHRPRLQRIISSVTQTKLPSSSRATRLRRLSSIAETHLHTSTEERQELIPEKVRQIMRNVPQSVAILTTSNHPSWEKDLDYPNDPSGIGMTLSSVNTVTLKPDTIISLNIKKPSHTLDAITYHGYFLIHFPSRSSAGARLADSFSKGVFHNRDVQTQIFSKSVPILLENHQGNQINLPALLPPSYPVNYVFQCEVQGNKGLIDVVDHVIVIGKVQKTWSIDPDKIRFPDEKLSLGYIQGAYCLIEPKQSS